MSEIMEILSELRPECDFRSSTNFMEDGLLDSFDVVAIVDAFERAYAIKIDALDILPEHFISIDAMVQLIKKSGGAI